MISTKKKGVKKALAKVKREEKMASELRKQKKKKTNAYGQ